MLAFHPVIFKKLELCSLIELFRFGFCNDPLAQSVEHLTFNQGVDGSSPSWVTNVYSSRAAGREFSY